jgi:hypothetical protein
MTILLPALAVAFAAFCVWLTVRIVNRHERWAKWTLTTFIGLPSLYVLSFGPACWLSDRGHIPIANVGELYQPVTIAMVQFPDTVGAATRSYGTICSPADYRVTVHFLVLNEMLRDVTPESR